MQFKLTALELGIRRLFVLIEVTRVTRYAYMWGAYAMLARYLMWAYDFASTSPRTGTDVAAIIAAIGVPISWVVKGAIEQYSASSRQ